jgi:hypothetical protein
MERQAGLAWRSVFEDRARGAERDESEAYLMDYGAALTSDPCIYGVGRP